MTHTSLAIFFLSALAIGAAEQSDKRAAERKTAQKKYELQVEKEGWKGASLTDLRAVYNSACSEIAVHFGEEKLQLEPIRIRHDKDGPIVLFTRSLRGELIVQLSASGNYWSQHAYQVAHEFCHILCRFKQADRSNLWFEESLCELASIYALRQMAITWETDAPYPNWNSYGKSLKNYADDVASKHALPEGSDFPTWFKENEAKLRNNPTRREHNGRVAVHLLPLFEEDPAGWQALPYLNIGKTKEKQTFGAYLKAWHDNSPEKLRPFVTKIAMKFKL